MSTGLAIARRIILADEPSAAWDVMRGNPEWFLWTDQEELEEVWNALARKWGCVAGKMQMTFDDKGVPTVHFRAAAHVVPVAFNRSDSFVILPHAVAKAGREALEFRYCCASSHSSNQAYFPCPPHIWRALDAELGAERLAQQFLPLPDDVHELEKRLVELAMGR